LKIFEEKLLNLVDRKEAELNGRVTAALEQDVRVKWKTKFELQWTKFKSVEKQRCVDRLCIFFHCQLPLQTPLPHPSTIFRQQPAGDPME